LTSPLCALETVCKTTGCGLGWGVPCRLLFYGPQVTPDGSTLPLLSDTAAFTSHYLTVVEDSTSEPTPTTAFCPVPLRNFGQRCQACLPSTLKRYSYAAIVPLQTSLRRQPQKATFLVLRLPVVSLVIFSDFDPF